MHVSNNVCFSSPLHKQNITRFCIENSHLPFPLFFGSLLIYPVYISHCDSDVPDLAPSSSLNPSQWENFSPSVTYGFLWETFPAYKLSSSKMSAHTDTIRVYGSLLRTTLVLHFCFKNHGLLVYLAVSIQSPSARLTLPISSSQSWDEPK